METPVTKISFIYVISSSAAAAAKSLHLCLTLCDPIDSSPPGSPVPGILQGRVLEWDAIAFSIAKSQTRLKSLSTHANGFKIVPLKSFMKT